MTETKPTTTIRADQLKKGMTLIQGPPELRRERVIVEALPDEEWPASIRVVMENGGVWWVDPDVDVRVVAEDHEF